MSKPTPIAAKSRLAFVPDDAPLFHDLTVEEHLSFYASIYQVSDAHAKALRLLDEFELTSKLRTPASNLSRGMRQKLAICCAYLHDPQAILFDEPLTGLDPQGIRVFKRSLQERAAQGAAVMISSHMLAMVEDLCTHVLILDRGRAAILRTDRRAADELRPRRRGREPGGHLLRRHILMTTTIFHPATVQLLRLQSRGRRRRMWARFCQPRRLVLSAIACVLAVVWLGNAAMTIWLRETASPETLRALLSLGLVLYAGWHFAKAAFFRPESPFDWTPAERELLVAMPLRPRDLVAYQLASVTVTTMLKAGLFTLLLLPDLRCVPLGLVGLLLAMMMLEMLRMAIDIATWGMSRAAFLAYRAAVVAGSGGGRIRGRRGDRARMCARWSDQRSARDSSNASWTSWCDSTLPYSAMSRCRFSRSST